MRRIFHLGAIALLFLLFSYAYADAYKWVKVGKHQTRVFDSGDQSESAGKYRWEYYYVDFFNRGHILHSGWHLGTRDWTDENGKYWPVKISGAGHGTIDENFNTMPVPDSEGVTAFRYYRYTPPTIVVDGIHLEDKWPLAGDYVDATKVPGTADVVVESDIRTSMGITIHQRVLGWNQKNHDDYVIYEWTFENTGNVDLDDEVELKTQTLEDVYFLRSNNWWTGAGVTWHSTYGEYPTDTLRLQYAYPQRTQKASTDNFGDTRSSGFLRRPWYIGETTLHADKSATDKTDDPSQPHMTAGETAELLWIKNEALINSATDHDLLYQTMRLGFLPFDGTPEMEGTYPGTHHGLRLDEQGIKFVRDFDWFAWRACSYYAVGPYTLAPGESFKLVRAILHGSISPEESWRIGLEWKAGTLDPPPGMVFGTPPIDNLPPQYTVYPELYEADSKSTEENNWAKDCWVATGKDSLFINANAALWNFQQGYVVPIPPPPPSIEVISMEDWIRVKWGTESEAADDFAGYRVYRAVPTADSTFFSQVFECSIADNDLTNTYDDIFAGRGIGYTYYVGAFDNGEDNITGIYGTKEVLESGRFLNETTMPAYLKRAAAGALSAVRVVPNPFNISATDLQYPGEPDKIIFMEIPPVCDIMIYTQSGDLIRTIHHTDGSGDEPWGVLSDEHSTTETGQIIVSGVYIAYIEIPEGEPNAGDNTFVKFVVIR